MKRLKDLFKTYKQLRYLVSGVLSEIIEYASFGALLMLTSMLTFSNSISFILGIVSGFFLHKWWSFAGEQQFKTHQQVVAYGVLATANFFMSNILINVFVQALDIKPYIAKLVTMFITAIWSYVLFNFVIFKHKA